MINIENEFSISATSKEVWDVITQLHKYGEWNSFVSECKSSLLAGEPIYMKVHLFPFLLFQKETIYEYTPNALLSYGVNLPFGLLKSYRCHRLTMTGSHSCLYQSGFCLEGILSPIVKLFMESRLNDGFCRMTNELKSEVLRRQL